MHRNAESERQKSAAGVSLQESHSLGGTLQPLRKLFSPPLSIPILCYVMLPLLMKSLIYLVTNALLSLFEWEDNVV